MIDIMIIDDSAITRKVIKRVISMAEVEVGAIIEAEDGIDALEKLEKQWVDVILCDINMPRMNGFELVGEIKKDPLKKAIPIIMITTEGSPKRIQELTEQGISDYIIKPFYPEQVKSAIDKLLVRGVDKK
ncbi:MAG: response regulator [Candidatus Aureabacteria bacterium]|nr:response regulator [Candidatus Auribacterota bacterium]